MHRARASRYGSIIRPRKARDRLTRWLLVRDPQDDRAGATVESASEHEHDRARVEGDEEIHEIVGHALLVAGRPAQIVVIGGHRSESCR